MKRISINLRMTDRSESSFDYYLQEVKRIPMINAEEEIELSIKIKKGDGEALHKLVCANLRFVVSVAKQYKTGSLSLNELVCEGNIGLIKAAKKFDHTRGFKFIPHAVWWIRQSIIQYLTDKKRTIRLPNNFSNLQNKVNKHKGILSQKLQREPTTEELSEAAAISPDMIDSVIKHTNSIVSLDETWEEDDRNLYDLLADKSHELFEQTIVFDSVKLVIRGLLKKIPDKERVVLCYYFGLEKFEKLTLIEISHRLNITAEGVRQIRERGLRRLRKPLLKDRLKEYCI